MEVMGTTQEDLVAKNNSRLNDDRDEANGQIKGNLSGFSHYTTVQGMNLVAKNTLEPIYILKRKFHVKRQENLK